MNNIQKLIEAGDKIPEGAYVSGDGMYYEVRNDHGSLDYLPVNRRDALELAEAARSAMPEIVELEEKYQDLVKLLRHELRRGWELPATKEWNRIREIVGEK